MMKNAIGGSIFFATMALGLGACGPTVPDRPTWEHDIRPLMVARCIRCHDGAGHVDPLMPGTTGPLVGGFNFNYPTLPNPISGGLVLLHTMGPKLVRGPVAAIPIMPPPPAERLEDWEIQLLDNWAAENPPL